MMKVCSKCGESKPRTSEYFHKRKDNKDGFEYRCKICASKYQRQYRENNRDALNEASRQYYIGNREECLERSRKYREDNIDDILKYEKQYREDNDTKIREYRKTYYENNKNEILERHKAYRNENKTKISDWKKRYYLENKESILNKNRLYRLANPEKCSTADGNYYIQNRDTVLKRVRAYKLDNKERYRRLGQERLARIVNLPYTLTTNEWVRTKSKFNDSCCYCGLTEKEHHTIFGERLHQDHFIPLSKGGGYTEENIIPACRTCNCSKNDSNFYIWYKQSEHFTQERYNKIVDFIESHEGEDKECI